MPLTAKWEQVAADLEQEIATGQLQPGADMPSESDLVARHGWSRNTVRQALDSLADRGLITGRPGARRKVAHRVLLNVHVTRPASRAFGVQAPTDGADSWRADIERFGHKAGEELSVREGRALEVAGRLGYAEEPVTVRELLRSVDDRPHNVARWYFPEAIASGTKLAHYADIPEGSIPYLSGIGFRPDAYQVEIEGRMPSRAELRLLDIPNGVSLLVEYRTGFGPAGDPVFVSMTLWPSDRARLILEL